MNALVCGLSLGHASGLAHALGSPSETLLIIIGASGAGLLVVLVVIAIIFVNCHLRRKNRKLKRVLSARTWVCDLRRVFRGTIWMQAECVCVSERRWSVCHDRCPWGDSTPSTVIPGRRYDINIHQKHCYRLEQQQTILCVSLGRNCTHHAEVFRASSAWIMMLNITTTL